MKCGKRLEGTAAMVSDWDFQLSLLRNMVLKQWWKPEQEAVLRVK